MVESPSSRLIEWTLATFHTAFFFLVFVIVTFGLGVLGSLLGSLNTIVGIVIFAVLWLTTWWTTPYVLAGTTASVVEQNLPLIREDRLLLRGILWGGINGAMFFIASESILVLVGSLNSFSSFNFTAIIQVLGFAWVGMLIGSPFAFIIGGIFGVVFALIDFGMLAIARLVFAMLPYETDATSPN